VEVQGSIEMREKLPHKPGVQQAMELTPVPMRSNQREGVARLLRGLDERYPNAFTWLDRRIDEIIDGRSRALVCDTGIRLIGVAITTPKGLRRAKLSTIKVISGLRQKGIGTKLIRSLHRQWIRGGLDEVSVTVSAADARTFSFLQKMGFHHIDTCHDRYGPERHEHVLIWTPTSGCKCRSSL
jgi:ribosomal protein S18 acetylase RimI-like enzyme